MNDYDFSLDGFIAGLNAGAARARKQKTEVGFQKWMAAVDAEVERRTGASVADLPDCCFMDWFLAGTTARSAAGRAIRDARE